MKGSEENAAKIDGTTYYLLLRKTQWLLKQILKNTYQKVNGYKAWGVAERF
jgi:hypothetical protein